MQNDAIKLLTILAQVKCMFFLMLVQYLLNANFVSVLDCKTKIFTLKDKNFHFDLMVTLIGNT